MQPHQYSESTSLPNDGNSLKVTHNKSQEKVTSDVTTKQILELHEVTEVEQSLTGIPGI